MYDVRSLKENSHWYTNLQKNNIPILLLIILRSSKFILSKLLRIFYNKKIHSPQSRLFQICREHYQTIKRTNKIFWFSLKNDKVMFTIC